MDSEGHTIIPKPHWVISDTHFGHNNILIYCPWRRNWAKDIEEHDAVMIAAWNKVVGPDDWVLHLGDFSLAKSGRAAFYRSQLQGKICLILGNHDRSREKMLDAGFDLVTTSGEVQVGTRRWLCYHNPHKITPEMTVGMKRVLHGHLHGDNHHDSVPEYLRDIAIDCGVDALLSVAPVRWMDVR